MMAYMIDAGNNEGLFGVFEDDGDTGYLYLYKPEGEGIIDHLHIYSNPEKRGLNIKKKDVEVVWSDDKTKCGVKVWGRLFGIFDLASNQKVSVSIQERDTQPIQDPQLLKGFS